MSDFRRTILPVCGALALNLVVAVSPAQAFDYLEHSYFTDTACHRVQAQLATHIAAHPDDVELKARYLALGLFCPTSWQPRYCEDDEKLITGSIHDLARPPALSRDVSLTLGDYAALPDHFARFGPVKNLPLAGKDGLWDWTTRWMTRRRPGGVGGVVEDVAEDACETDGLPDWERIQQDIDAYLARAEEAPLQVPESLLSPLSRAPIPRGPTDPAGAYSFDNPHYLDLVLRNHNHFGVQAYSSWLGFHGAGIEIASRSCESTLALDDWRLRKISKRIPGFDHIDFGDLPEQERATKACAMLGEVVRGRLDAWRRNADPALLAPVARELALLLDDEDGPLEAQQSTSPPQDSGDASITARPDMTDILQAAHLLDATTSSVMGLVFEGSGLHFLQDGLAAGHMRTIRTRGGLKEARYDHDQDNRHGVVALMRTRAGVFPLVAFGDSFMLGPVDQSAPSACEGFEAVATGLEDETRRHQVSVCLIQHQRGILTASSMASLLDWALGGTLYGLEEGVDDHVEMSSGSGAAGGKESASEHKIPNHNAFRSICERLSGLERFICAHLPSRPTFVAGEELPVGVYGDVMHQGSLPVPPPPFSYEALTTRVGFDIGGRAPQVNVSFTLLSELDDLANWLTSYRLGLTTSLGDGVSQQGFIDFTYSFHWRWAARFLIDGGVSTYAGFRDFDEDPQFFTGLSPVVGLTALPEGWIKIPLEFSLSYRLPINVFVARQGFFQRPVLDGHWLYVGFGLAFM